MRKRRKRKPGEGHGPGVSAHRSGRTVRGRWSGICLAMVLALYVLTASGPGLVAKEKKLSKTVSGLVMDKDENGIAGATIELTDVQTGKKVTIVSEEGGRYKFSDLQPTHDYELQAKDQGLESELRKVSSFDSRNRLVINLKISPAKSQ